MNFESIRLQPNDPYLDRWIATSIPLVDKRDTFEWFMKANDSVIPESWNANEVAWEISGIQENKLREANSTFQKNNDSIIRLNSVSCFSQTPSIEKLARNEGSISFFEWLIKKFWLPKTLRSYEKLGKPWGVIISDTMLKFHNQDVRKDYLYKNIWQK